MIAKGTSITTEIGVATAIAIPSTTTRLFTSPGTMTTMLTARAPTTEAIKTAC